MSRARTAQHRYFSNPAGGSWDDPANWSTGLTPQAGDDVIINQPGNVAITLSSNVSINSLNLTGDTLNIPAGITLTTSGNVINAGTLSASPSARIVVGGNFTQSANGSLLMPGEGTTVLPATNLLTNPDFESPTIDPNFSTPADGWSSSGSALLSDQYAYTGLQSLQMNEASSTVYQTFDVTPGISYTLSVYAMSPAADHLTTSEAGYIQVLFYDGDGNPIVPAVPPMLVLSQGGMQGGPLAGSVGSDGWNAFHASAVAPPNAVTASAVLLANNTNGPGPGGGSTFWDDPQFGPSVGARSKLSAVNVSNGGQIIVGPTNAVTASGTFTQTSTGLLDVQLGGPLATGDYGLVSSLGSAKLGGTLQSEFVYGYTASIGDVFTPIQFPNASGAFGSMSLPTGPGFQFQGAVTFTNVTLSPVPTTPLITTIDAGNQIHSANPNLLGTNLTWYDPALTTTQTQQMAKTAGLTAYAFPGGSGTDSFHFNSASNFGSSSAITAPQFAQFVTAVGGTGLVTLDYGSGSPQEAAAELAYFEGSASDTTPLGVGIQWNAAAGQWQNVDWRTVGYWASLRGASPLATNDGFNFLRIKHAAPFTSFKYWEVGNEEYLTQEADHHGTPGPLGVSTGAQHDPATYAAFAAQFANYASEIISTAGLPAISIGIDSGDPTGRRYDNWIGNVLADGQSLGFIPGFISDHQYMQGPGEENDANLLNNTIANANGIQNWTTRYNMYQSLMQQTIGNQAANVQVMATEFNSVTINPGKQSTSLVNGLFMASSIGGLLASNYSGGFVWDLRDGWMPNDNNKPDLYGWRQGGDYGLLGDSHTGKSPSTGAYIPNPGYFAEQLASKLIQPGGMVVTASSNYQDFYAYSVLEPNGHLDLMVINANPVAALNEQFNIAGFQPSGQAQFWQYGEAQDTAQSHSSIGASALANFSQILNLNGNNFSYAFPAYSMTVIDLSPESPLQVAKAAAASPATVTGKTTALSVLGAENGNDSILTYSWAATSIPAGVAAPTFSINGSNVAKNTTATFFGAGKYTFLVTMTDANQQSITSSVTVTVAQKLTSLTLTPTPMSLPINTSQQFAAHGFDQFHASMPATITWSLASGSVGKISSTGLYSAGTTSGSVTVRATSGTVSVSTPVTVIAASVSGMVYNDSNAGGTKALTEKGLSGRTVYLQIAGKGTTGQRSTTTNSAGTFSFKNLPAGSYVLIVPTPSGWRSMTASSTGYALSLSADASIGNLLFGQTQLAYVGGIVYLDANKDGKKQSTESGLSGWTVQLLSATNASVKFTTTTNSSGAFSFGAVSAGSYKLSVITKTGYIATSPSSNSYTLSITAGKVLTTENFGQRSKS